MNANNCRRWLYIDWKMEDVIKRGFFSLLLVGIVNLLTKEGNAIDWVVSGDKSLGLLSAAFHCWASYCKHCSECRRQRSIRLQSTCWAASYLAAVADGPARRNSASSERLCNGTVSVRLSVPSIKSSGDVRVVCCWARRQIAIDSGAVYRRRPSCSCGQRHVESRGTRLNTDLFIYT